MGKGRDVKAGGGFVTLDLRDRLQKGLKRASARLKQFGASVSGIGRTLATAGAAIAGPLLAAAKNFASVGDKLDKMSQRTGVSVESLGELGFAAEQSGASLEGVEATLLKMNRRLGRATSIGGPAAAAMQELGLSVDELSAMNPEQRFLAIGEAIRNYGDDAAAAGIAQRALGTGVDKLLPMFLAGGDAIDEMRGKFRELGGSISGEQAAKAAVLTDKMNELWVQLKAVAFQAGGALADSLIDVLKAAQPLLRSLIDWIKENQTLIAVAFKVGAALLFAGTALVAIGSTISIVGTAIGALAPILGFLLSPVGLVIAAIAAAGVAFFKFTETGRAALDRLMQFLKPVVDFFRKTFRGLFDAIAANDFRLAGEIAIAGLRVAFGRGMALLSNEIGGSFGDLLGKLSSQLLDGDFAGAFSTLTLKLSAMWDGFVEGLVAVFTTAARALTDVWEKTTTAIASSILELAANEGIVGDTFDVLLGIDVSDTNAKLEKQERERLDNAKSSLKRFQDERAALIAAGQDDEAAKLDNTIAQTKQTIEDLGGTVTDFTALAQESAAAQLGSSADSIRAKLDEFDRNANERARASREKLAKQTAGGVDAAAAAADKAQAEFDELIGKAAEQRKALEEKRRQEAAAAGGDAGFDFDADEAAAGAKAESRGTFSAAAAQLIAGQGRRPAEERIAERADGIERNTKKIADAARRGIAFA